VRFQHIFPAANLNSETPGPIADCRLHIVRSQNLKGQSRDLHLHARGKSSSDNQVGLQDVETCLPPACVAVNDCQFEVALSYLVGLGLTVGLPYCQGRLQILFCLGIILAVNEEESKFVLDVGLLFVILGYHVCPKVMDQLQQLAGRSDASVVALDLQQTGSQVKEHPGRNQLQSEGPA
jgi:hypothetical protein